VQAAGGAGRIIGLLEALFLVPPRFSFFWVLGDLGVVLGVVLGPPLGGRGFVVGNMQG
jgi:hypothetical protein